MKTVCESDRDCVWVWAFRIQRVRWRERRERGRERVKERERDRGQQTFGDLSQRCFGPNSWDFQFWQKISTPLTFQPERFLPPLSCSYTSFSIDGMNGIYIFLNLLRPCQPLWRMAHSVLITYHLICYYSSLLFVGFEPTPFTYKVTSLFVGPWRLRLQPKIWKLREHLLTVECAPGRSRYNQLLKQNPIICSFWNQYLNS